MQEQSFIKLIIVCVFKVIQNKQWLSFRMFLFLKLRRVLIGLYVRHSNSGRLEKFTMFFRVGHTVTGHAQKLFGVAVHQ